MEDLDHYEAIPEFNRLRNEVLWGDVWKQTELSLRDRSLVTCAILGALGKTSELEYHMGLGIENGLTPDELRGLVVQLAIYSGWPNGVAAAKAGLAIFKADSQKSE
ncbi:hypothetical protein A8B82_16290 [Sulfitobacter sp. EhC04]|uniref:carboxymuconolactone decarboxylase family protein n=1 Tax=Sulfitobacter sp. EhC04 TaxID=1849168 RepID=UPI0007F4E46D|nr:carboxymuconolactone decarboxylase family protein [Sulfitobacter sp. EhC04]OAN75954.1 hypothetical protein A8B82_16290 [Sulfitobacter sp. EhC04]